MDVESLPVLVPPITAQTSNQFTAPAGEDQEPEHRHHNECVDPSSPVATYPQRAEEDEPQCDAKTVAGTTSSYAVPSSNTSSTVELKNRASASASGKDGV